MRQLELQTDFGTFAAVPLSAVAQLLPGSIAAFDVSKNISLVPVFHESKVESYFGTFDQIATALH